ncbi:MAG: DUF975 family protein [Clostridiales bacterium]|nr:DUF975 family protein [Clostridiales bacterium]
MFLTSYIFKSKAVRALKGNWQTALIVSFIAGLPATVSALLRSTKLPEVALGVTYEELLAAVRQIDPGTIWLLAIVGLISFIVTPMLSVGCYQYFIKRIQGEELGIMGVFSRRQIFGRALFLYLYMYVRIFLWSLLLVIPGIIAALRYALAPYFLAEDPDLTPAQAIDKSKEVMADKKLSLAVLLLSFIGWALMALVAQMMLISFSVILAMVAYQFIELFRVTYMNASVSAFYLAASRAEGIAKAKQEADAFVRGIRNRMPGERHGDEKNDEDTNNGDKSEEP